MSSQRCRCASSGNSSFILRVGAADVLGIARQRHPAERALAAAEQRPDVGRHEARESRRRRATPCVERDLADVVAVVERSARPSPGSRASPHVRGAARRRRGGAAPRAGRIARCAACQRVDAPARRQVAVDEVVRRGLVGDQVGRGPPACARRTSSGSTSAALPSRPTETGAPARACARPCAPARRRGRAPARRGSACARRKSMRLCWHSIASERGAGQASPPAAARRPCRRGPAVRIQRPRKVAAVVLAAGLDEGLVGALHDALAADVDPGAGGHLAVHHQALAVELVEVLPGRPVRHQVGVGDQHARRVGVGAEDADRLARLDQQRLVVARASRSAARIASKQSQLRAALPMPP